MADIVATSTICGAQKRGKPGCFCKLPPLRGRTRCKFHGGMTPQGAASPHFINGRRSRHLPTRLGANYEEARRDPDLVKLRDDLAVTDALLTETLESLKDGSSEWARALESFERFQQKQAAKDLTGMAAALTEHAAILKGGAAGVVTRDRILEIVMVKRKLVDSEVKREKTLFQMMSSAQVMTFVAALVAAVQEEVPDAAIQARIDAKFQRLLSAREGKET